MMVSVDLEVNLVLQSNSLASPPGKIVDATFKVQNLGPAEKEYKFVCIDELGFVTRTTPSK